MIAPVTWNRQRFGGESHFIRFLKKYLPKHFFEILELGFSLIAYQRLAKACRQHKPDLLYERFNLYMLAGGWIRRRFGLPYFLEVNAPVFEERQKYHGIALRRLARYLQKKSWIEADRVLPVTDALAGFLRRDGVPEERIAVIRNGVDPSRYLGQIDSQKARKHLGLDGKFVLGFVGFIHEWHGLSEVMHGLANSTNALQDVVLLIVGEGPEEANLRHLANSLGIDDRVQFAGLVERAAIPEIISTFDIALQPAATAYASPLKLFEYMALGRAIVAPAQPNIREILIDRETALLFDSDSPGSLFACVRELHENPALRRKIGAAAKRSIIKEDRTWIGNVQRIENLFFDLQCREKRQD